MKLELRFQGGGPRRKRSIGRGRPFFVHALTIMLLLGCVGGFALPAGALTYYSSPPFPTGRLLYSHPTLRWKVWPAEPYRVQSVYMTVNGRPVFARYVEAVRSVLYTPDASLRTGEYSVRCGVVLDNGEPLEREWRFEVAETALHMLPEPDREPQKALEAVGRYRRLMGLPNVLLETALCASADSHCRYLDTNSEFGHYETPGHHDFTGRDLLERNSAFGYWGGGYEDVSYGTSRAEGAVDLLFDAPYHRLPFMQPGTPDFGMGRAGKQVTLEFGLTSEQGSVVYPASGQKGVALGWSGNEEPNPLRIHGAQGRTGYVITFAYFSPNQTPIDMSSATLTDHYGDRVRCFVNSPGNDNRLSNAVFLIPEKPLEPLTTYTVLVRAATADGADISRRWSFTTGQK